MKYRTIEEYRMRIRYLRELSKPVSWTVIAEELGILTEDGRPNPKLAQEIGYKTVKVHGEEVPYEPTDEKVRQRLNLRPICSHCHRPLPKNRTGLPVRKRVPYKDLLLQVALPALKDIAHFNNLTMSTRRERALNAYKTIEKELENR